MDLKEKSSAVLKEHRTTLKAGVGKSFARLIDWVMEPGSVKDSAVRALSVLAAVVLWFACAGASPLFTVGVTLITLFIIFLRSGMNRDDPAPGPEPKEEEEESPPRDEFWLKYTPSEDSTVRRGKTEDLTDGDGDVEENPTVPLRMKTPIPEENPQVSDLLDSGTPLGTPESDERVTGYDAHVDHVGIFPVTKESLEGQPEVSQPQVSGVSQGWDTPDEQATELFTESEIGTDEDENFSGMILKFSDRGLSVREIAEATGRKRSTVGRILKNAKDRRERMELVDAAVHAARTETSSPGIPVPQVVLPGAWHGEDSHAQEVRFTGDAVALSGERAQEDAVPVMEFIRTAFLGKTETTTENWSVSLDGGVISGSAPGHQAEFRGFWSETGTVVINRVSLQ